MANTQESDLEIRKREIELGQALARLKSNPDFQEVVLSGYIEDVLMKQSQYMISMDPASRQMASEMVMSANYFRDYLARVENAAEVDDE